MSRRRPLYEIEVSAQVRTGGGLSALSRTFVDLISNFLTSVVWRPVGCTMLAGDKRIWTKQIYILIYR